MPIGGHGFSQDPVRDAPKCAVRPSPANARSLADAAIGRLMWVEARTAAAVAKLPKVPNLSQIRPIGGKRTAARRVFNARRGFGCGQQRWQLDALSARRCGLDALLRPPAAALAACPSSDQTGLSGRPDSGSGQPVRPDPEFLRCRGGNAERSSLPGQSQPSRTP